MVLKGLKWVHNDKIGSNGLKRHNTNIGVTFLGKWSFVSLRNLWISVFDVVPLKVELEMCFLQFVSLNLPENCSFNQNLQFHQNLQFSSKAVVFIKICGFLQNPQFSQKPQIFIKICGFCHFSLSFQEDNIKTKIGIL